MAGKPTSGLTFAGLATGLSLVLAGCGGGGDLVIPHDEQVANFSLDRAHYSDADILFVIDNSGSMAEEQALLANNFQRFMNVMENMEGGLPNLHVGVVSTDVGAGPFNISGCSGSGDNGQLQSAPNGSCTPPSGAYISDVDDGAGGRIKNYTGTLAETFSCIARLGIDGCGFEQQLEAMKRALNGSNPFNAGFLRPEALLAVVIISDEDDCSASDTNMFDTAQNSISDPLGPLSSFRCFEFGVECDPDTPRTPGPRQDCEPRNDSPYMYSVDDYVTFLESLKADPHMVVAAGIIGDPTPVSVGLDEDEKPKLEPSCVSASGEADPAVRLAHFFESFPQRNTITTICNEDLSDALLLIAQLLARTLVPDDLYFSDCLAGALYDTDPDTEGLQPACQVTEIAADASQLPLPECDSPEEPEASTNLPCYLLRLEATWCDASGEAGIETFYEFEPAAGSSVTVTCTVL